MMRPTGLKPVATFMAIARYVLALSVFVVLGVMLGLFLQSKLPASNWDEWIGGGMGLALALTFTIEGYIQRWYKGFSQFQRVTILWAVLGAVLYGIYALTGKNDPGNNTAINTLYSMLATLAVRLTIAIRSWAERS